MTLRLAAVTLLAFAFVAPPSFIKDAQARIGRPATPGSVAGVARRTTRRHLYGAAAVGAGGYYYGHRYHCYRNEYGRLVCP